MKPFTVRYHTLGGLSAVQHGNDYRLHRAVTGERARSYATFDEAEAAAWRAAVKHGTSARISGPVPVGPTAPGISHDLHLATCGIDNLDRRYTDLTNDGAKLPETNLPLLARVS